MMVEAKKRTVGKRVQREKADAVEKRPVEVRHFKHPKMNGLLIP